MAVDMSDVLKPVTEYEITEGFIRLGGGAFIHARPTGGGVDVSLTGRWEHGWVMAKDTLMNLSEAARLLAEALP